MNVPSDIEDDGHSYTESDGILSRVLAAVGKTINQKRFTEKDMQLTCFNVSKNDTECEFWHTKKEVNFQFRHMQGKRQEIWSEKAQNVR